MDGEEAMKHPGSYLEKRMGRGRQCWSACDRTPCRCKQDVRRSMRRGERIRVTAEIVDEVVQHEASRLDIDDDGWCDGCDYCDPSRLWWAEYQQESV
jgi:hypothetical protein